MGQGSLAWRPGAARAGTVAAAVVALLAGCGSAHPAAGSGVATGRHGTAAGSTGVLGAGVQSSTGPPAGSRAEALALAGKLLPRVILPSGSRELRGPVPPRLRGAGVGLGSRKTVGVHRQFALPLTQSAASAFVRGHTPVGMRFLDNGSDSDSSGLVWLDLAYAPRHLPVGIYQAEIDLTLVPAVGGGSLLRADAQVIWLPPRTAAEHVDPARFASVAVTADEVYEKNHPVTKRITSREVITQLATLLNAMPADPGLAMPCPMAPVIYRVGFAATAHGRPGAVATTGSCFTIALHASGHQQPQLADPNGKFAAYLQHLLGIRQ
jgi:hypothetical protein